MRPSRGTVPSQISLPRQLRARSGALALFAGACLGASCGLPPELAQEGVDPESGSELTAQSARVPQATRVDPATAFAGASPMLTITGRNFTPDLNIYIDGNAVPVAKLVSSTQVQVQLPATINALGKKLLRVENSITYRGSERDDLFSLVQDPVALLPLELGLDGETAAQVAAGDVNGDGKPDVFVLSSDGKSVHLYLSSGRGRLQPGRPLTIYSGTTNMVVGDMNGDGKLDLVTVAGYGLYTHLGDGTGKFTEPTPIYISSVNNIDSRQGLLAIADANGDGKADVVFGTHTGEIDYAIGKGDGTFGGATALWYGPWPIFQIQVADVNKDSKPDLLVVGGGDAPFPMTGKVGGFAVLQMQVGTPPLTPSYTYSTNDVMTAVTAGDYNGDGKLDAAAVVADGRLLAFTGGGDGKFPSMRSMTCMSSSGLLFSADWNRDGKLDLLLTGRATPTDYATLFTYYPGVGDGSFGSNVPSNLVHSSLSSAAIADFDQDMKLDIIGVEGYSSQAWLSFGRGDGSFLASPGLDILWRDFVTTADFNGDGIIDFASASVIANYGSVALGLGDGGFKAGGTSFPFDKGPSGLAAGDFNGDGKVDLAATNYDSAVVSLMLGNGDGTLANQRTFSVGKSPNGLAVGDVNADGKLDIVTANSDSDNVSVLIGNGTGNFATSKEYAVGKNPIAVVLADFNADGRLDVVTANADSNTLSYLQGSAAMAGAFNAARTIAACPGPSSLSAVDINADGKLDLVSACTDSGDVAFLIGRGDGTFNAVKTFAACAFPFDVQIADLGGDGKLDLAVGCGTLKRMQIFIQIGDLAFTPSARSYAVSRGYFVGDLSGDHKADVLLTESPNWPLLLLSTGP